MENDVAKARRMEAQNGRVVKALNHEAQGNTTVRRKPNLV
jgi:hypothetical protein